MHVSSATAPMENKTHSRVLLNSVAMDHVAQVGAQCPNMFV